MTLEQRLLYWREVDPDTGCWNRRGVEPGSYGSVYAFGRTIGAHRLAAILWLGLDPISDLFVLHKCDNRRCFNPEHLKLGTHYENMQDRKARGRYAQPARNRKLNWSAVRLIRELRFRGYSQHRLAQAFDVNDDVIRGIVANEIWVEAG